MAPGPTRGIFIVGGGVSVIFLACLTFGRFDRELHVFKEKDYGALYVKYDISFGKMPPISREGYLNISEISAESTLYKHGACVNVETDEVDSHLFYKFHNYTTFVNIRFIVLTYNRGASLAKVLQSLQGMELDGHNATVEIWIDRSKSGKVDTKTLKVARSFCWNRGPVFVHIHGKHAGLYGQWINTWAPPRTELPLEIETLVVYLEDDTDISRFAYRWLRQAHITYGHLAGLVGYSLQDENVMVATGKAKHTEIRKRDKGLVYGYPVLGSWGFAPHPDRWRSFQAWFVEKYSNSSFKPYVIDASLNTDWYKTFEKKHKEDGMWTMWMIRFCWEYNLFSIFSNTPTVLRSKNKRLVFNRKEAGLHYGKSKVKTPSPGLMNQWSTAAVKFPTKLKVYDYTGKYNRTINIKKEGNIGAE